MDFKSNGLTKFCSSKAFSPKIWKIIVYFQGTNKMPHCLSLSNSAFALKTAPIPLLVSLCLSQIKKTTPLPLLASLCLIQLQKSAPSPQFQLSLLDSALEQISCGPEVSEVYLSGELHYSFTILVVFRNVKLNSLNVKWH